MPVLYTLNLAAAVLLMLWPLWFSRRYLRLPALNPLTIAMAVGIPFEAMKLFGGPLVLIEEGLFDDGYQLAVLMANTLLASQVAGTVFFLRRFGRWRIERRLPMQRVWLSRCALRRGAWLFLLLFLVAFYLLASAEFGLGNWLANPREGYQLYRTGQGHWYALAITCLSVSMLLGFLARPTGSSCLLRLPVYLGLAYLLGSKGTMLALFVSNLAFLWFIRWRHLTRLIVLGAPCVFALLVYNLALALGDLEFQAVLEYFDYYKNGADYYRAWLAGDIDLYWGEILWSSFTAYIPRAWWPDKPFVYGALIITELFYPGAAELTNTPAFGGAVEQFADFGPLGVILGGFFGTAAILTALTSHLVFRRPGIDLGRVSVATVALLLVQAVPTFGTFFPGALYLVLLLAVVVLVRMVRPPSRRRRAAALQAADRIAAARPAGIALERH